MADLPAICPLIDKISVDDKIYTVLLKWEVRQLINN